MKKLLALAIRACNYRNKYVGICGQGPWLRTSSGSPHSCRWLGIGSERDLVTAYGLQVVGGVIATLLGQGVDATIVCDRALSHPVRKATLHAAADAITVSRDAAAAELYDAGWERAGEHGWQLLLGQR